MQEQITFPNGTTIYLKDGKLHRENGPAIEFLGSGKAYFIDGALHSDKGPAIYWPYEEDCHWYVHGVKVIPPRQTSVRIAELRDKFLHSETSSGSSGQSLKIRTGKKPK